jgi:hypothetical protein
MIANAHVIKAQPKGKTLMEESIIEIQLELKQIWQWINFNPDVEEDMKVDQAYSILVYGITLGHAKELTRQNI